MIFGNHATVDGLASVSMACVHLLALGLASGLRMCIGNKEMLCTASEDMS